MEFAVVEAMLGKIRIAAEADRPVDEDAVAQLASELDVHVAQARETLDFIEAKGLAWRGGEGLGADFRHAAEQYLALQGAVDDSVLSFLPNYVEDLHARRALISAGTVLVDQFRDALVHGHGVQYAQDLVPEAFAPALTDFLALQLYSAAVALMVRLSDEQPAGCIAEEIVAVRLIGDAEAWLNMEAETGDITADEATAAIPTLRSLFSLFEDDDVLDLFEMEEPSDAAIAGHSKLNRQLGVADQRLEAWFQPFTWTIDTGYLLDSPKA